MPPFFRIYIVQHNLNGICYPIIFLNLQFGKINETCLRWLIIKPIVSLIE